MTNQFLLAQIIDEARSGATLEELLQRYEDEDIDIALSPGRNWDGERWTQFD